MDPELAQILEEESRHNFRALGVALGTWVLVATCEVPSSYLLSSLELSDKKI